MPHLAVAVWCRHSRAKIWPGIVQSVDGSLGIREALIGGYEAASTTRSTSLVRCEPIDRHPGLRIMAREIDRRWLRRTTVE